MGVMSEKTLEERASSLTKFGILVLEYWPATFLGIPPLLAIARQQSSLEPLRIGARPSRLVVDETLKIVLCAVNTDKEGIHEILAELIDDGSRRGMVHKGKYPRKYTGSSRRGEVVQSSSPSPPLVTRKCFRSSCAVFLIVGC